MVGVQKHDAHECCFPRLSPPINNTHTGTKFGAWLQIYTKLKIRQYFRSRWLRPIHQI